MHEEQKKTVYFVRHGQSVDNVSPVFQSVDSPLSEKGIAQAQSIADRLAKVQYETLIASPVRRARQTAQFIADKAGRDIVFSDLFVERIKPTSIDGMPYTNETANRIWRAWEKSMYTPGSYVEDGENYDVIISRADEALTFLQERPESTLAVVTHGYFLRVIVARVLLGDDLTPQIMKRIHNRASIENTAITVLHYRDGFEDSFAWRLWTLNDHSHFAE